MSNIQFKHSVIQFSLVYYLKATGKGENKERKRQREEERWGLGGVKTDVNKGLPDV